MCCVEGRFPEVFVPYDTVYGMANVRPMCPYCYALSCGLAVVAILRDVPSGEARAFRELYPRTPFPPKPPMSEADVLVHEQAVNPDIRKTIMAVIDKHRWASMGVNSAMCECGEVVFDGAGAEVLHSFPADIAFRQHLADMIVKVIQ